MGLFLEHKIFFLISKENNFMMVRAMRSVKEASALDSLKAFPLHVIMPVYFIQHRLALE